MSWIQPFCYRKTIVENYNNSLLYDIEYITIAKNVDVKQQ